MRHFIYILIFLCIAFLNSTCSDEAAIDTSGTSNTGIAGSLARFCISGNFLYALDFKDLSVIDISNPGNPVLTTKVAVGTEAETIFPLGNWLFLGTQTGMLIFQIGADGVPGFRSSYEHVRSCDPVVADGQYAYVTLRSNGCPVEGGLTDRLEVLDISNVAQPELIGSYGLNEPYGLGLRENILFVCDGSFGVKVFDVSDPTVPQLLAQINDIDARDVIALNGLILVIGPENIYEYDTSNPAQPQLLSLLPFGV